MEISRPVEVTILGEPRNRFPGRVLNVSGKGMRLLLDRCVPLGTPLGVHWSTSLLLGEVCYCYGLPEEKEFAVGLRLEQALTNTMEIARLAHKLLGMEYQPVTR